MCTEDYHLQVSDYLLSPALYVITAAIALGTEELFIADDASFGGIVHHLRPGHRVVGRAAYEVKAGSDVGQGTKLFLHDLDGEQLVRKVRIYFHTEFIVQIEYPLVKTLDLIVVDHFDYQQGVDVIAMFGRTSCHTATKKTERKIVPEYRGYFFNEAIHNLLDRIRGHGVACLSHL